jgi:hypothetical protein
MNPAALGTLVAPMNPPWIAHAVACGLRLARWEAL